MKGIDLFCASPASTAICVSMDSNAMVRHGGRAIDRHSPHLIDRRRTKPSHSHSLGHPRLQPPSKPKSTHQKHRKQQQLSSAKRETDLQSPPGSTRYLLESTRRKSSAHLTDLLAPSPGTTPSLLDDDAPFIDVSNFDRSLVPLEPRRARSLKEDASASESFYLKDDESAAALESFSIKEDDSAAALKSSSTRSHDQVVVLRVSLHCKGCEGKVRKHISKMEGVRSFSIDFPSKKVTVKGDVTPLGVLASISKVKNAQFWPSSAPSTSSSLDIS
ncbi:hypothetical protein ACLOJK_001663 [Asimina triloba]